MNRYADWKSRFDFDTTVSLRRTKTIQDHVTYPPRTRNTTTTLILSQVESLSRFVSTLAYYMGGSVLWP